MQNEKKEVHLAPEEIVREFERRGGLATAYTILGMPIFENVIFIVGSEAWWFANLEIVLLHEILHHILFRLEGPCTACALDYIMPKVRHSKLLFDGDFRWLWDAIATWKQMQWKYIARCSKCPKAAKAVKAFERGEMWTPPWNRKDWERPK